MSQLRGAGDDVTHGPHAVHTGALVLVGRHEAAPVHLDAQPVGHQAFRAGAPAHRHDDCFGVEGLVHRLHRRRRAVLGRRVPLDLHAGDDVDAPLLERADEKAGDVVVAAREDGVECLQDRHLGAEVGQERRELTPDDAAADDHGRGGERLEVEELVGRHDQSTVDLEAGQQERYRSGRQDDVAADNDAAGIPPVDDFDTVVRLERARADQRGDLAALEQPGQALVELAHHGDLAVLAHREVDRHPGHVDAELLGVLDRPVDRGRLEEFLGRDATTVQAGTADLVPLDNGDGEARCGAVERSGVAAGTTANHDDVELVLACHRLSSPCVLTTSVRRARPPRNNPIALARVLSMPCA